MITKRELIQDANQKASDHIRRRIIAQQLVDQWVREGKLERLPGGLVRFTEKQP
jgi:hypothetical protein